MEPKLKIKQILTLFFTPEHILKLHKVYVTNSSFALFFPFNKTYNFYAFFGITYLLTPRCTVLPEQLTGLQLVKKFPAFHGTRRFITALTSVRHLSLSGASPIQSTYPHPTSWRSILILSTHLRLVLPSSLFPSSFPTKTLCAPSPHPYAPHAQPISFFSILSSAQYWVSSTDLYLYHVNSSDARNI